jgi:hypothetical protein
MGDRDDGEHCEERRQDRRQPAELVEVVDIGRLVIVRPRDVDLVLEAAQTRASAVSVSTSGPKRTRTP